MRPSCLRILGLLVLGWLALCAQCQEFKDDPVAAPAALVTLGRFRLTVLTPHLVRIEARRPACLRIGRLRQTAYFLLPT